MGGFANKTLASALLLALGVNYCSGQQRAVGLMRTSGQVIVNGTQVSDSAVLRENDVVDTLPATHASVTSDGTAVRVAPGSHLIALDNAYRLDRGGTIVMTVNGISTKVKAYTIVPHDRTLKTDFEVNWSGQSVYVYARIGDLDIHGPCDNWKLHQGEVAVIEDPWRCKPGILILNDPATTAKYAALLAATSGGLIAAALIELGGKDLSCERP